MSKQPAQQRSEPGAVIALLSLMNGPIIWALHLASIYFIQSMACTLLGANRSADAMTIIVTAVAVLTVSALAALVFVTFARDSWRGTAAVTAGFLQRATVVTSILSSFAILAAALTIVPLPPCAQLR